jgi:hypothetical protein
VSREDLLRALTPQDEASAAKVSKLLCDNLGARSWDVVVLGGAATVLGTFHNRAEEAAVAALAASVPGGVELLTLEVDRVSASALE